MKLLLHYKIDGAPKNQCLYEILQTPLSIVIYMVQMRKTSKQIHSQNKKIKFSLYYLYKGCNKMSQMRRHPLGGCYYGKNQKKTEHLQLLINSLENISQIKQGP